MATPAAWKSSLTFSPEYGLRVGSGYGTFMAEFLSAERLLISQRMCSALVWIDDGIQMNICQG
jgi:hypothetical protein